MTTNILEAIKQAYAAGLTDGARQSEVIARIHAEHAQGTSGLQAGMAVTGPGDYRGMVANGARKRPGRVAKATHDVDVAPKAPAKARGARKARGPREKGVKERIVSMIAAAPMTAGAIITQTGFKSTSVRATLMSLKKAGLAFQTKDMQGNDGWIATGTTHDSGNSGDEAANV